MGFFDRFRSPEVRERRAREQASREAERQRFAQERLEQQLASEEAGRRQFFIAAVGDELAAADADTPEQAKFAIKLARIRKKELLSEKRQLAAELADVREGWRERQAGATARSPSDGARTREFFGPASMASVGPNDRPTPRP